MWIIETCPNWETLQAFGILQILEKLNEESQLRDLKSQVADRAMHE